MTTLIVTASSKSKTERSNKKFSYQKKSFYDCLSEEYQEQLIQSRKEITEEHNIEQGPDILEKEISEQNEEYLPAYIRYTGRTYSKITNAAWNELNDREDVDCVILSALYGLIRYNEPIQNYTIEQKNKVSNSRIMTYWKNSGAKKWLLDYIKENKIEDVKFVLSTSYSKIIQRESLIEELKDMGINAEDKQFKSAGRASMLKRGTYINDFLLGKL